MDSPVSMRILVGIRRDLPRKVSKLGVPVTVVTAVSAAGKKLAGLPVQ